MNSVKTELEANCKAAAKEVVAFEDPSFAVKYSNVGLGSSLRGEPGLTTFRSHTSRGYPGQQHMTKKNIKLL